MPRRYAVAVSLAALVMFGPSLQASAAPARHWRAHELVSFAQTHGTADARCSGSPATRSLLCSPPSIPFLIFGR